MKSSRKLGLGLAVLLLGAILPSLSSATNGYFLIGYGAKSRAMGGASIGYAQDAFVAATNPAELSDVGMRGDLDVTFFYPRRRAACCVAPDGVVSGSNTFLIPALAVSMKFNRKMSFGFSATGAGANTRYNRNFFIDDPNLPGGQPDNSTLGVSLIQMVMAPSGSYNFTKNHSLGFSLLIGAQQFRAYGLQVFKRFSKEPDNLTNRGNDYSYGWGWRVGWRSHFFKKKLTFGASYAPKMQMTDFHKYRGLFARGGGFDVPSNYGVGISIKPTRKLAIAFDVYRILYSDIPSVGNPTIPISAATDPNDPNKLGAPGGPGFGWDDQTVYKVGLAYRFLPKWTVRLGYNHGSSPIPNGPELEVNTLAPAVNENHYTIGGSYDPSRNVEWNFAYVYAARNKQTADLVGTDLPFNTETTIEMKIHALEVGFAYKF